MKKLIPLLIALPLLMGGSLPPTQLAPFFSSGSRILATATDTFDRANANPISSPMSDGVSTWDSGPGAYGNIQNNANTCRAETDNTECCGRVSSPTFTGNHRSTITIGSASLTGSYFGVAVRLQGSGNGSGYIMIVQGDSTTLRIYKTTDSGSISQSQLGADITVSALAEGDTIGLGASGTSTVTLTVYRNGVATGDTRTDSTSPYTGGQPGVYVYNNFVDAFTATDE